MSRVGLVGGLGPEATLDYYRRLVYAWRREDPLSSPSIVIDSVDDKVAIRLVEHDRPALTEYVLESLHRLHGAGVHFAAITSNTTHLVFDRVAPRSPVPLISIVDVCVAEARRLNLRRLALFGTRFVMEARLYPAAAQPHGIQIVVPARRDRTWLHERYVGELVKVTFATRRDGVSSRSRSAFAMRRGSTASFWEGRSFLYGSEIRRSPTCRCSIRRGCTSRRFSSACERSTLPLDSAPRVRSGDFNGPPRRACSSSTFSFVKPEAVDRFLTVTRENARNSIREPVVRFDVIQQEDDPTRFVLVEVYRSPQDPARTRRPRTTQRGAMRQSR